MGVLQRGAEQKCLGANFAERGGFRGAARRGGGGRVHPAAPLRCRRLPRGGEAEIYHFQNAYVDVPWRYYRADRRLKTPPAGTDDLTVSPASTSIYSEFARPPRRRGDAADRGEAVRRPLRRRRTERVAGVLQLEDAHTAECIIRRAGPRGRCNQLLALCCPPKRDGPNFTCQSYACNGLEALAKRRSPCRLYGSALPHLRMYHYSLTFHFPANCTPATLLCNFFVIPLYSSP